MEKVQDPLVARSTSRPIFASVIGYRRSSVDTIVRVVVCWLVVSTLVAFMYFTGQKAEFPTAGSMDIMW